MEPAEMELPHSAQPDPAPPLAPLPPPPLPPPPQLPPSPLQRGEPEAVRLESPIVALIVARAAEVRKPRQDSGLFDFVVWAAMTKRRVLLRMSECV